MNTRHIRNLSVSIACAMASGYFSTAHAAPAASGSAYDLAVHVSIAGVSQFDVAPFATIAFSNQTTAWSDAQQSLDVNAGNALATLHAGDVSVTGEWSPGKPFLMVGTRARVDNLNLQIADGVGGGLLGLASDLLQSTSVIGGTCPAPTGMARSSVAVSPLDDYLFFDAFEVQTLASEGGVDTQGLTVTAQAGSLLGLPLAPPPNTTLTLPGGLGVLVLNERNVGGNGISGLQVSTNAAHLTLNALGVLVGDVVIAHSDAAIACQ